MNTVQIKAGVGIFVIKDGKFLVGLRNGSHGAGEWALPGGHIEPGEHFYDTARREVAEETGMQIESIRFAAVTNSFHPEVKAQYISIWVLADWQAGESTILETEKCAEQRWVDFETLPRPLFGMWEEFFASEFYQSVKEAVTMSKKGMI